MVIFPGTQAFFRKKKALPPWYNRNRWKSRLTVLKFEISGNDFFDRII
ncbi:hypothetical protein HMPREF1327_02513 [Enterococcus faecalis 599]|nr:hypothetical protein HMPREF1327_02513 [Enterococcus faecalis 599]